MKGFGLLLAVLVYVLYDPVLSKRSSVTDICDLPIVKGRCYARLPRWGHVGYGICVQFYYGGCGGNDNNFRTKQACERTCQPKGDICQLPKVVGPCRARKPRYYFNGRYCQLFYYGGCRGNANNFKSRRLCEARCGYGY